MAKFGLLGMIMVGSVALAGLGLASAPSFAIGPEPAPPKRCGQFKEGSSEWKRCMSQKQKLRDDEDTYARGYWLAVAGEHAIALDVLRSARNAADPRIQTMIGFSLRQLGLIDEAMAYYAAALATAPDATSTRQYLGEAFLQKGDRTAALTELETIGRLCGTTACEHYQLLAAAIAKAS